MEHYKISKLLNNSTVSEFVTRKCIEVKDISWGQYSVNKNVSFKTPMLTSDVCHYSDTYIVVKGTIYLGVDGNNDMVQKVVVFKN